MAKRLCLECGGELVMAFRPSESGVFTPGGGMKQNANWRCSTCGHSFTAEQLRTEKHEKSKASERA